MGRERGGGEDQQTSDHLLERCSGAVSWSASVVKTAATRRRHGVCASGGAGHDCSVFSGGVRVISVRLVLHRDRF